MGHRSLIKLVIVLLATVGFLCFHLLGTQERADASAMGPSPSNTNAPGEANCTACHTSFAPNSGTGKVEVLGLPHDYLPGQQVTVSVRTSQVDATIYGFQVTALDGTGKQAGTFSLTTPAITQIVSGPVAGFLRNYVEHRQTGVVPDQFGSKTWIFKWTAPSSRVGKISFYAAGNAANGDGDTGGDYIYTTVSSTLSGSAVSNFNGDQTSDLAVWRPSTSAWMTYNVADGATTSTTLGELGDQIVPGDYDGDGTTDRAVFRPVTATWYIQKSGGGTTTTPFGMNGDVPVPGDYDGDGKTDLATFRPSTGTWNAQLSSGAIFPAVVLGAFGDRPVPADYDGDAKTDVAVFRPSTGLWTINQSTGGTRTQTLGSAGDQVAPADFDGDGKADVAVYSPSTGMWTLAYSATSPLVFGFSLGGPTDIASPGDYDGDGRADITVFQPATGMWVVHRSSDNTNATFSLGTGGDIPVASNYRPDIKRRPHRFRAGAKGKKQEIDLTEF